MSIVKNGRKILSNVIDTQISIHEKFGGVVPEIASRNHVEAISTVMKKAVADANININDIDAIATAGLGVAMANAIDKVKEIADVVMENDCDHSGCAEAIEKYLLG